MKKDYCGIILAAGMSSRMGKFEPMRPVGNETIIKRTIRLMKESGVEKIIVVTGYRHKLLKKHLSDTGAEIVFNKDYIDGDMFASLQAGLKQCGKRFGRYIVMPGDMTIVCRDTLEKVMNSDADYAYPVFKGEKGHPAVLAAGILPLILKGGKNGGLHSLLLKNRVDREEIPVKDESVILRYDYRSEYEKLLKLIADYEDTLPGLRCEIEISIGTDSMFFDSETATFLEFISLTGSMRQACRAMHMSYTKAWNMINRVEDKMNVKILTRSVGGAVGGGSSITKEGNRLLEIYNDLNESLNKTAARVFSKYTSG